MIDIAFANLHAGLFGRGGLCLSSDPHDKLTRTVQI